MTIQEIYYEALQNGKETYKKYFTDIDTIKKIISLDIMAFKYVPDEYKTEELCIFACQKNVYAYHYIPKEYKSNKQILYSVLSQYGLMLKYCPDWVKSKKEFVRIAAKNNLEALNYANKNVLEDREFAKEIVSHKPIAIKFFTKFNNDVEICNGILNLNPDFKKYVGPAVIKKYEEDFLKLYFFHLDNAKRKDDF